MSCFFQTRASLQAIAAGACSLLANHTVLAADSGRVAGEVVGLSQMLNLLGGLILVLLAFFIIVYLLKRVSGLKGMSRGHLQVIDALHLGTKEKLVIVKVNNAHLLLGLSAQGIHPLHVIEGELPQQSEHSAVDLQGFHQVLARFRTGGA